MANWLTWNPITGCTKYSDGCKNCYALSMALKFQNLGVKKYKNGFDITFHEDALFFPSKTQKPSLIFANSMTDLFHDDIQFEHLKKVFDIMNNNPQHIFFVLTKRADRMEELSNSLEIKDHIRMGVTIESNKYINRINSLKKVNCKYKYVCIEPLLSEMTNLNLEGINWVTGGNESGPFSRYCKEEWIIKLGEKCKIAQVPFSFKFRGCNENKFIKENFGNFIPEEIKNFGNKNQNQMQFNF